jgi:hypothetical protein
MSIPTTFPTKYMPTSLFLQLDVLPVANTFVIELRTSLNVHVAFISGNINSIGTNIPSTVAAWIAGINSFQTRYVAEVDPLNPARLWLFDTLNDSADLYPVPIGIEINPTVNIPFVGRTSSFFSTGAAQTASAPLVCPSSTLVVAPNMFTIDGAAIDPCGGTCGSIGQTLGININQGFPVIQFAIIAVDTILNKFVVSGNQTLIAIPASTFDVTGSTGNDGSYVVISSVYDSLSDTTTISVTTAVVSSVADGAVGNFSTCSNANRQVHVVITNLDSGLIVLDQIITDVSNTYVISQMIAYTLIAYGKYQISYTASDCFSSVNQLVVLQICFNYKIDKTDCHVYNITDNDTSGPAFGKIDTVTITNQDSTYSQVFTIDTSVVNFVTVTFPKDGIYKAVITNNLSSDVITMPIYDLCDTIACTKKLILDILCNEADPCCTDCSDATKRKKEVQRAEMNKIIALGSILIAEIRVDELNNLGVFVFDSVRELNFEQMTSTFASLDAIIDRCGECKKNLINPVTPCLNC